MSQNVCTYLYQQIRICLPSEAKSSSWLDGKVKLSHKESPQNGFGYFVHQALGYHKGLTRLPGPSGSQLRVKSQKA